MSVAEQVETFILAEIAFRETIAHDEDLIETDLLDSAGIVALLGFLEQRFGIAIDEDVDLIPDNFRTIDAVAALVTTKLTASGKSAG